MPHETEKHRWERNFGDLLQEMRVAQNGVQILFAFLLVLPFTSRFDELTAVQRTMHLTALLTAACAAAAFIAPVAFHRMLFRRGRKPEMVRFAHRASGVGLACLLLSMVAAVLLVTDFLLPRTAAIVLTGTTGGFFLVMWGLLPLSGRDAAPDREPSADEVANLGGRT
ncbi:DUF6328 family protein [Actinoplanes sp. NPDC023714]|uniref:DUF6328 family protein n=1 Tax=Actinoplanes sp. NPDC023714 TaxID=3154322 RepID=UPI0033FD2484